MYNLNICLCIGYLQYPCTRMPSVLYNDPAFGHGLLQAKHFRYSRLTDLLRESAYD